MQIEVKLKDRSYPILIRESFDALAPALHAQGVSQQLWVLTHKALMESHGRELLKALRREKRRVEILYVPEGEKAKRVSQYLRLSRAIAGGASMRTPWIVAFGGGVVGDLSGLVAATYRRGVPWVQVPTSLLAQVDASIGGKVGVDLPEGKNLLGAYHQPRIVFNNTSVLRTLPLRQRRTGLAEVIKYGVIADAALFRYLEARMEACLDLEPEAVGEMVRRSCAIKARVVSRDEREAKGLRLHLNFGHTLGHAIEAVSGYSRYTHGEAIAIGMCAATRMAITMGECSESVYTRLLWVIESAGLPTHAEGVPPKKIEQALRKDKKFVSGSQRWVLPNRIGRVAVSEQVPLRLVKKTITEFCD